MSDETTATLLTKASGYGVLLGVGGLFALGIVVVLKLMERYLGENTNSTENFMVANRNIGVGLTGSVVFSSWYWASEILWVVTMVYSYGIMSAFWYFAGLSVQICVMSVLGINAKKKIPKGHTCLEIINLRYGKTTHILYMFLCLVNNLLSTSSMILGAAGAISVISGNLNTVASTMLIPFGVIIYTVVGGLKATFLTDYLHSLIALIILVYFNTAVLSHERIGGIGGLYDLVLKEQPNRYIKGNYEGSFLTGKSQGAIFFGIIHCVGDFGLTVMDSSFWQKSFSANVRASVPGYLIAAICIPAVVWPLGTIVGLANVALERESIFPTYPRLMTSYEVNSGFGLPYTLKALLGNKSLGGILLAVYLAVTSTVSAQMIAVSSIISFDIFKTYIKPSAKNKELIRISHGGVVFFGLFSAGFSVMLHYVGVDMTWMAYFYPMIICPGVIPLILSILWDRQTKLAAIVSPIAGLVLGILTWLLTAWKMYGEVTIGSTGEQLPCLYGGLVSLFLPGIVTVLLSLSNRSYKFDWQEFDNARLVGEDDDVHTAEIEGVEELKYRQAKEKKDSSVTTDETFDQTSDSVNEDSTSSQSVEVAKKEKVVIELYIKIAYGSTLFVFLITWVVWPLPLYRDYIFSKSFFAGWTVMSVLWLYMALIVIGLYPLWDGRHSLLKIYRGIKADVKSRR